MTLDKQGLKSGKTFDTFKIHSVKLTDTDNASVKYQGFYLEHIFTKKMDSTHPNFKICE